jgi:hypothetical protein
MIIEKGKRIRMNTITDRLFDAVDRVAGRLGAVNTLADKILGKLAPNATAVAGCNGNYPICSEWCDTQKCYPGQCVGGQRTVYHIRRYTFTPTPFSPCGGSCAECNDECGSWIEAC